MDRYILYFGDHIFGLSYKSDCSRVVIGGNKKFIYSMETIITEYFQRKMPKTKKERNKIRYTLGNIGRQEFNKVRLYMEDHGFIFQQVNSLERIMR